jgi:hypothetical protein
MLVTTPSEFTLETSNAMLGPLPSAKTRRHFYFAQTDISFSLCIDTIELVLDNAVLGV